ncbi:MAG TPA: TRAP transporter substrate-binding protein DctP [Desulfobulbaceae bacterium]|nr:MAG: TRAP dicarboxylate transporter subunit DctP [Deltaproteobacteria bacterium RIFOXYD12_FULL_53_23]HCC53638.1 TRAP transporter substrate-binding protein DctP [Desulfobulbaceae bacterium]
MSHLLRTVCLLMVSWALMAPSLAQAAPRYLFKIATLAPDGSVWARHFQAFQNEVTAKSNGEIGFKLYMGGVMGDDRAMYRKMRIGQLQGGGFTMTGISETVPDFRVMAIPFLFRSYAEVDRVAEGLFPLFQKAFLDKDLVLLAMTEVGFVYTMSGAPVTTVAQLRASKCWAPENDPLSRSFLEDMGVTPIPLSIPDVLSSLQTGMINTVFNGFYGSIVLQWFTKTKYITDTPFGYAYGGLVFAKDAFDKLPPQHAALMATVAKKHFAGLLLDTRRSNEEALVTLKNNGVKLVATDKETLRQLMTVRDQKTVPRLVGTAFSKGIYEAAIRLLTDFRAKPAAGAAAK